MLRGAAGAAGQRCWGAPEREHPEGRSRSEAPGGEHPERPRRAPALNTAEEERFPAGLPPFAERQRSVKSLDRIRRIKTPCGGRFPAHGLGTGSPDGAALPTTPPAPPSGNPYAEVFARVARREGGRWSLLLPIVAAAAAMPLARPVMMGFLDQGRLASGTEGLAVRMGALVAAAMALHTYSDLVRSPDRPILDAHPVQPRALLRAVAARTARQRLSLPVAACIFLLPVGVEGSWTAFAGACGVIFGAWLSMLGVGFTVHLGGVWAGFSPRLAVVLDALRGDNPRMQAALIYAPGVALAVVGMAVLWAAGGLSWALQGDARGWAMLALPPALGLAGWLAAGPLADRQYVRATALLTEVDALGSQAEDPEESRRVYLEWLAADRPELLRQLRNAWRGHRTWAFGAWLLGLSGALAGWSDDPAITARLATTCGGAGLLIAALPSRLVSSDPPWLDRALGVDPRRLLLARAATGWLYAQGALLPAVATGLFRHKLAAAPALLTVELLTALGALGAAALGAKLRQRATLVYGALAVLAWAALAGATS